MIKYMLYMAIRICFIFFVSITIAVEPANANINITQRADNILNCTISGTFEINPCTQKLVVNSHTENSQLPSSPAKSVELSGERNEEALSVIDKKDDQSQRESGQSDIFSLAAIGSFLATGGLILIGWKVNKTSLTQKTEELKKRVEILEAIIAKE